MIAFRNEESRKHLTDRIGGFEARLPGPLEHRVVETRFGATHVTFGGLDSGPVLVVVHGAMASSAHALGEIIPLFHSHRVVGVDVIGQSPRSADARLPLTGEACTGWLTDVLDALNFERVHLLGVSWGGFVASRAAAGAPARFISLTLVVPAGFIRSPVVSALMEVAIPMVGWRLFGHRPSLRRLYDALFSTFDPAWFDWFTDSTLHFNTDFTAPPLAQPADVRAWTGPTLVVGGTYDLSFPGVPLLRRIHELWPEAELELVQCRHAPPFLDTYRAWFSERVERFIAASAG